MKSLSALVLVVLFAHCWAVDDVSNSEVLVAKDKDVKVEKSESSVVAKRDQRIDNSPGYYGYNYNGYNGGYSGGYSGFNGNYGSDNNGYNGGYSGYKGFDNGYNSGYNGNYGFDNNGYNSGFGFPIFGNGFGGNYGYQPVPLPTYGVNGYPIFGFPPGYSGFSDLNGYGSLREADKALFNHLYSIRLLDKEQEYPGFRSN